MVPDLAYRPGGIIHAGAYLRGDGVHLQGERRELVVHLSRKGGKLSGQEGVVRGDGVTEFRPQGFVPALYRPGIAAPPPDGDMDEKEEDNGYEREKGCYNGLHFRVRGRKRPLKIPRRGL